MSQQNLAGNLMAHGYDVVAYFENEARVGDPALAVEHEGVRYYFANETNKKQFEENPARYVPAYGGWCAYAMSEGKQFDIDPRSFKVTNDRLYLFYDGVGGCTIDIWNEDETGRAQKADSVWRSGSYSD
ncbi:MAG: YHS domain-containing (seleno)protein [Anaerolineae bacterium]